VNLAGSACFAFAGDSRRFRSQLPEKFFAWGKVNVVYCRPGFDLACGYVAVFSWRPQDLFEGPEAAEVDSFTFFKILGYLFEEGFEDPFGFLEVADIFTGERSRIALVVHEGLFFVVPEKLIAVGVYFLVEAGELDDGKEFDLFHELSDSQRRSPEGFFASLDNIPL